MLRENIAASIKLYTFIPISVTLTHFKVAGVSIKYNERCRLECQSTVEHLLVVIVLLLLFVVVVVGGVVVVVVGGGGRVVSCCACCCWCCYSNCFLL